MKLLLAGCLLACTLFLSKCQNPDANGCPLILPADMGSTASPSMAGLIAESYTTGDNPTPPNVRVTDFSIVCQAASEKANMSRGVSVVVRHTCDGGCEGAIVTSQFDLSCIGGQWRLNVLGFNSLGALRTTPSDALLTTPLRTDCSICISPDVNAGLTATVDPITHCAACDNACNVGRMECSGFSGSDCCSYYEEDDCVDSCSSNQEIDPATSECVCPGFFTGPSCTECSLVCENGGAVQDPLDCSICACSSGFDGATCGDDIDECADVSTNPCMNSATCENTVGSFMCNCAPGFDGDFCQDGPDEDDSSGGLSERAIIGIIIGCIIGLILIVLIIVCVLVGVHKLKDPPQKKAKHKKMKAPPHNEKPKIHQSAEKEAEFTVKEEVEEDEEGDDISLTRIEEEEGKKVVLIDWSSLPPDKFGRATVMQNPIFVSPDIMEMDIIP